MEFNTGLDFDTGLDTEFNTEQSFLEIQGARVHNLRNISLSIPRNQLTVITGISGSGKSSLAFDTIYAEGQRRYMESLSAYARQFLGGMERPDVEYIGGLSPVIAIEQKTVNKNPRSTVGTITEIYDFLRLLFARIGEAYSYETGKIMQRFSEAQIIETILEQYASQRIVLLAPVVKGRKGHYRELFEQIRKQGFVKVRVDGNITDIGTKMQLDRYKVHDIEIVIDRLEVGEEIRTRLAASVETTLRLGSGTLLLLLHDSGEMRLFSNRLMCVDTGISYEEPSPNTFSFNSPYGACPECKGLGYLTDVSLDLLIPDRERSLSEGGMVALGELRENYTFQQIKKLAEIHNFSLSVPIKQLSNEVMNILLYGTEKIPPQITSSKGEKPSKFAFEGIANLIRRCYNDSTSSENIRRWADDFMEKRECPTCQGKKLKREALWFKIAGKNIAELGDLDISQFAEYFVDIESHLNARQQTIARDVIKEIRTRTGFLLNVGLNYLTLSRLSSSLSGGEAQRIRLATQIGSQLIGITYILDEPSIGLHQRDNQQLIAALRELTDMGNTVLVVEHDKDMMLAADYVIDMGPKAGKHGGMIVGEGQPDVFGKGNSLTAQYLRGERQIPLPTKRRAGNGKFLTLHHCTGHNLKKQTVCFPLGTLICITGVSGSGKSSLINETLYPALSQHFYKSIKKPLPLERIEGLEHLDKVIQIDQAPIGRTPRSNPATYIGLFTPIRDLYASLPEAKIRGYKTGRFSFNVAGGRCSECEGGGMKVIEMNFLPDVYVQCEKCLGKRYNRETLEVRYKGKSIGDVLNMTVEEAVAFFEPFPKIHRMIKTLHDVGLDYITLGQPATTLSGGEAQRVKLAAELQKKDTGSTCYILDEPTTGLHFEDILMLMQVINKLVDKGNTVMIVEHNLDVVKTADYVIDMGPEGGSKGGIVICKGSPEEVAASGLGYTAAFLKKELAQC